MLTKINTILDITIKSLSLIFTGCILLGSAVVWTYLKKAGVENQFSTIISTPQVLFSAALHSLYITAIYLAFIIITPSINRFITNGAELNWNKNINKNNLSTHFMIAVTPLLFFLWLTITGPDNTHPFVQFILLSAITSLIIYRSFKNPEETKKSSKFQNLIILFFTISTTYIPLSLSFIFILKASNFLGENEALKWLILLATALLFSFCTAKASSSKKKFDQIPLAVVSTAILLILFADQGSRNIISKLGLGNYKTSYTIESKHLSSPIEKDAFDVKKTEQENILRLNNVWVVVDLPKKLILSPSQESRLRYSIPYSAILSEVNSTK